MTRATLSQTSGRQTCSGSDAHNVGAVPTIGIAIDRGLKLGQSGAPRHIENLGRNRSVDFHMASDPNAPISARLVKTRADYYRYPCSWRFAYVSGTYRHAPL